jgi:ABC-2 type transport system ATP-binding protein
MSSPLPIEIENLSYAYGHVEAVHDLSLTVKPGRCYGLFGRNGAGKTTTMKCLLNLLRPQSGKVRVFGLDPAHHEVEVKRSLSYVPDPGGVLSVDERARDAGLPCLISPELEPED